MLRPMLTLAALLALTPPADACHRFSVWKYPYPQRCSVAKPQADRAWFVEFVLPAQKPVYMEVPGDPDIDIPLPGMDTQFPPDCDLEWCQRLKEVGLSREHVETTKPPPRDPAQALARFTVSKYDTIILTPVPGRTDEEGRAQAIEILKQVMN